MALLYHTVIAAASPSVVPWRRHGHDISLGFPHRRQSSLVGPSLSPISVRSAPASPPGDPSREPSFLQRIVIPSRWGSPEEAIKESEWLRERLHQWLDDEFCPEPANEEISRRCAKVYYYCLLEQQLDVGEILLQMVRELETFSFKESFHGAFSSANAAIDIITKKIQMMEGEK